MSPGRGTTPLLDAHVRLGAKLTEFSGWSMPLAYDGVVAEHNAVRSSAGVFDVSHLGKLRVAGRAAMPALERAVTADVAAVEPGRARYALVLADDGGCIDDLFVYRLGASDWLVVPNAANVDAVGEALHSAGVDPVDERDRWAILALQGPASFELFERVFPGSGATSLELHGWTELDLGGEAGIVARTGYTGERGFELFAPAGRAEHAFEALLAAGAKPVGLGARDTLRLEMGYALYGHELSREINPLEAGLGWALAWDTPFRGREALEQVRQAGPARRLFGIECTQRGVPRQGYEVTRDASAFATVTSGNFSPTLRTGIALALGAADSVPEVGTGVAVSGRGRSLEGIIVKPPFVKRRGSSSKG